MIRRRVDISIDVTFRAELEVIEHDGDLRAGQAQDDVHEQEESEYVVVLVHPDGAHQEEQLHKARAEGQDATK
jgi:hypothetical protein